MENGDDEFDPPTRVDPGVASGELAPERTRVEGAEERATLPGPREPSSGVHARKRSADGVSDDDEFEPPTVVNPSPADAIDGGDLAPPTTIQASPRGFDEPTTPSQTAVGDGATTSSASRPAPGALPPTEIRPLVKPSDGGLFDEPTRAKLPSGGESSNGAASVAEPSVAASPGSDASAAPGAGPARSSADAAPGAEAAPRPDAQPSPASTQPATTPAKGTSTPPRRRQIVLGVAAAAIAGLVLLLLFPPWASGGPADPAAASPGSAVAGNAPEDEARTGEASGDETDSPMAPLEEPPPLPDAASLVVTGHYREAARAYAALAREHPDRPELAEMARILRQKADR
ncbi:MAG TPA: hypothetical protein RMH99_04725 [Sandaracinaceae bacterium LLY-WYZ-13_1]|nr:hypothetical protein [Sandaracinaceae bacterium LLY-WYZ-13_1]